MIKKYTERLSHGFASFHYFILAALESLLAFSFVSNEQFLGFCVGLVAFGAAFSAIEVILRRVFVVGGVREGVLDNLFWVLLKFFGPIVILYYGIVRGFPVLAVVCGLFLGLINVATILFQRSYFDVKNH